ncbi:acyl-CoA N-acyltransferase [Laetiporus sulphureus 93-53]|uniref:Acyl-CoA N-acyltransferase n=1 Tax=Laetiporus sulphureus 93-53 TaxID=1314785 RepID=A0A165I5W1_9APHY|nr:acyl-CoA N-acyltransferase [Laetiporus sulphureus 93-53]KZT12633.1 acyl-CoA N-acyltransferase [Laetiporus sulphureus 93-53]
MLDSFVNNYVAPPPVALPDPEQVLSSTEPYDINYALPLHLDTLSSPTVRLTPFIPAAHAKTLWDHIGPQSYELFKYYASMPGTFPEFLALIETIRSEPEWCGFAVIDRTKSPTKEEAWQTDGDGVLAGFMALVRTSAAHLWTEIGYVVVFPAFQRTHVARTAVGLLLRYCLQTPIASPPGIGFLRIYWAAHPKNKPSIALARRMGFKEEGLLRWMAVLPNVKEMNEEGEAVERNGNIESYGRHTTSFAQCWDDWESGGRELIGAIIQG